MPRNTFSLQFYHSYYSMDNNVGEPEQEPVKEIYKNGSQGPDLFREFRSWKKMAQGSRDPCLFRGAIADKTP
jgi:hypothetical protein